MSDKLPVDNRRCDHFFFKEYCDECMRIWELIYKKSQLTTPDTASKTDAPK